jgi:GNAT superfamily N-acetyltransferase
MNLNAIFARLRTTYRHHGAAAALSDLLLIALRKAATFERVHLFALEELPDGMAFPDPSDVRLATVEELVALSKDPAYDLEFPEAEIRRLHAEGHRCALNVVDGRVAGYSWLAPDAVRIPKLGVALPLAPDEGSIYKGLTHPDFRGKRVANERFLFWLRHLRENGRRRALVDFAFDNHATLRRADLLRMRKVGTATLVGIGPIGHLFRRGEFRRREVRPL